MTRRAKAKGLTWGDRESKLAGMRQKKIKFTKMHGIGNDNVFVDCCSQRVTNPAEVAKAISDRHFGVGSDGLILIEPSKKANARMRIYNADGSQAEMCGNGIRCVAKYAYEHKLVGDRKSLFRN